MQILERLDQDVMVYCLFVQAGDRELEIAREKTRRFLEQCQAHTPRLTFTFLDPQKERARLQQMGFTHSSPQGTLVITCGRMKRPVSLEGSPPRLEEAGIYQHADQCDPGHPTEDLFVNGAR